MAVTTAVPGLGALDPGGFAMTAMAQAVKSLYHAAGALNDFIDEHVDTLKRSDNPLIASTGRVLEGAKFGFGLGYVTSVVLIAVGQLLLGNPLSAIAGVATAVTLSNPVAMTCAAIGAIYYGWRALSDKERDAILDRLRLGFEVGVELVRSMVDFVVRTTEALLTSKQLSEFKDYVRSQAALFGRSLYDVTRVASDFAKDTVRKVGELAKVSVDNIGEAAGSAYDAGKEAASRVGSALSDVVDSGVEKAKSAVARRNGRQSESAALPAPKDGTAE